MYIHILYMHSNSNNCTQIVKQKQYHSTHHAYANNDKTSKLYA